jgi:4-methylaminobutanoate oxidase (formaldehyde-forming)
MQEKGYRDYGHDMDNGDSLLECGLGFTCDFTKKEPFIGQDYVIDHRNQAKRDGGLKRRLASVLCLDEDVMLHHGEILWRDGVRIADIRAASYGHTLRGSIGLAMLQHVEPITESFVKEGSWEVEVGNQFYPCGLSLKSFYDPKNLRIRD